MTLTPLDITDHELVERLLVPVVDLVQDELAGGACPIQIAVLLQCVTVAASRFDPAAEDDFTALLTQAMREAARELTRDDPQVSEPAP